MRIAILVNRFPSVSQTFVLNQITGLLDRGHEVEIFPADSVADETTHPDVVKYGLLSRTYYPAAVGKGRWSRMWRTLGPLFRSGWRKPLAVGRCCRTRYRATLTHRTALVGRAVTMLNRPSHDVIHCHFGPSGLVGNVLREAGVLRGRLVTTFYGYDVARLPIHRQGVYDGLFASGDCFLALSETMRKEIIELGCCAEKAGVHHLGVDCSAFSFLPRRPDDDGTIRLLSIARFVEKKGLHYAIEAVSKLVRLHRNVRYVIIGDGELRPALERQIAEAGVAEHVQLVGWQDQSQVTAWLARSHVLVAPSVTASDGDQEGTPTVILEALATGLPVVSTMHSGIPEMVCDGESGFLVAERDANALSERLSYLVEHPEHWMKMGRAGRAAVEREYDIEKLNDKLVDKYRDLVKQVAEGGVFS